MFTQGLILTLLISSTISAPMWRKIRSLSFNYSRPSKNTNNTNPPKVKQSIRRTQSALEAPEIAKRVAASEEPAMKILRIDENEAATYECEDLKRNYKKEQPGVANYNAKVKMEITQKVFADVLYDIVIHQLRLTRNYREVLEYMDDNTQKLVRTAPKITSLLTNKGILVLAYELSLKVKTQYAESQVVVMPGPKEPYPKSFIIALITQESRVKGFYYFKVLVIVQNPRYQLLEPNV